jgi:hypothetical protein
MAETIITLKGHEWKDKDIEETQTVYGDDGKPHTVELDFVTGTQAVLLDRKDVIALAKHFDIVKLI